MDAESDHETFAEIYECTTEGHTMICNEDVAFDASSLTPCLCFTCANPETHEVRSVSIDNRAGLLEVVLSKDLGGDDEDETDRRKGVAQPSGTRWRSIGMKEPARGRKLSNPELAAALKTKNEFTAKEWMSFGIEDLRVDDYIIAGDLHFSPVNLPTESALSKASRRQELGACPSVGGDVLIRMDFIGADGGFNEVCKSVTDRRMEEERKSKISVRIGRRKRASLIGACDCAGHVVGSRLRAPGLYYSFVPPRHLYRKPVEPCGGSRGRSFQGRCQRGGSEHRVGCHRIESVCLLEDDWLRGT